MNDKIKVTLNDFSILEVDTGTRIVDVAKIYQEKMNNQIIGAKINNEVMDLNTKLKRNCVIDFFDVSDLNGYKMYQAGLKFVLIVALKEMSQGNAKVTFEHSIDKGMMCTIHNGRPFTKEEIIELKTRMQQLIKEDLVFQKLNVQKKEAIEFYEQCNESEKALNIQNITNSLVVLYKLKDSLNYFYVDMPFSTGVLEKFDLIYLSDGNAVLMFPSPRSNGEIPEYTHHEKIVEVFKKDKAWIEKMDVKDVATFNQKVNNGEVKEFIRMNELVFDNKINDIVNDIIGKVGQIKLILIAGPSSSGKTTTTKKLSMCLKTQGINVFQISVDDFFKERTETPRNEKGEYDYESPNSIDLALFNLVLKKLVSGEPVSLPKYDFLAGKKVFDKEETVLDKKTIIILEGLHCLNDELTATINREAKYKIYLAPFTPLSIDKHNYVSTVDVRMLRRMVRDNRTRGYSVTDTIKLWQNVRLGEEKYIFPYIGEADTVLNTALVYELGVIKVYAEPLLFSVDVNSMYYEEARRLLSFLKSFYPIPSEYVMDDSILREFIGGSIFE